MALNIIKQSPNIPSEASFAIKNIESPTFLVNFISSHMQAEVKEKQNNIYELTIDNGNDKQYYDFGKCNIYDNLLIKTNNGDNIQGKILHIDDNILSVYIENIEKK